MNSNKCSGGTDERGMFYFCSVPLIDFEEIELRTLQENQANE